MRFTKYDNLTTDELLLVAYDTLKPDEDKVHSDLAVALMMRLEETHDALEQLGRDEPDEPMLMVA